MGIGMILVVPAEQARMVIDDLAGRDEAAYVIGSVTAGQQDVRLRGGVFGE
jgi:phosphoribosylformylglycinamidine cyclo-ligase